MDNLVVEIAKQVPALLVLAFIVRVFLGHLKERDASLQKTLSHMGDSCHKVQEDAVGVMREVKEELGRTRELYRQLLEFLRARSAATPP